jgi:hypothetical protein
MTTLHGEWRFRLIGIISPLSASLVSIVSGLTISHLR